MTKFRFYITDTNDGSIRGTNSETDAVDYSMAEEYFVVDTDTGMWLKPDGQEQVKEAGT